MKTTGPSYTLVYLAKNPPIYRAKLHNLRHLLQTQKEILYLFKVGLHLIVPLLCTFKAGVPHIGKFTLGW